MLREHTQIVLADGVLDLGLYFRCDDFEAAHKDTNHLGRARLYRERENGVDGGLRDHVEETRPILEAFFHARFFLEMAARYGAELGKPPQVLPSGWAAFLYLFGLR